MIGVHDTLTPNVLKTEFSRKVIQIRALVALGQSKMRTNPELKFQLTLVTPSGVIIGDYCELYCSDDKCCQVDDSTFDVSQIDELANKVLIDAEKELVNIKLVDNAEFIKLTNAKIQPVGGGEPAHFKQLMIYADQITAFTLCEVE